MDYKGKKILAPMVRIGTLPMRLLALSYGADLVYTEEIIDFKILQTTRIENEQLGTVDYVHPDGSIIFRTCKEEKSRLVFQMGTNDADRAVQVARLVANDISAVDVNMGCPKKFSIEGGMGAALLQQPDKIRSILTSLVASASVPVTCKIRVLENVEESVALARLIEQCGVAALGVHGRTTAERPQHENRDHYVRAIAQALTVPVIANGGSKNIRCWADCERFRLACGAASAMVARSAQCNPSIFRQDGPLPMQQVMTDYLQLAVRYSVCWQNTKYVLVQMEGSADVLERLQHCDSYEAACEVVGCPEIWEAHRRRAEADTHACLKRSLVMPHDAPAHCCSPDSPSAGAAKAPRVDPSLRVSATIPYEPRLHGDNLDSPAHRLFEWCRRTGLPKPVYEFTVAEKRPIACTLLVNGHTYENLARARNKQIAKQQTALVALIDAGILDRSLTQILQMPVAGAAAASSAP